MPPPYFPPRAYPLRPNDEATGRNSVFATDEIAAEYADIFGEPQPSGHFASKAIEDEYRKIFSDDSGKRGFLQGPYPDEGVFKPSDRWKYNRDDGSPYSDVMWENAKAALTGKSYNGVPLSDEQRFHVAQLALPLINKILHDTGVREEAADPAQSAEPQLRGLPSLTDRGLKKGRRRGSLDKVARTWLPTLTSIDANMEMSAAVKRIEEGNSDLKDWALMANVDKELKEAEIAAKDNSQIWNVAESVITSLPETVLLFWAGAGVGGKLGAGLIKSKLGRALPKALRTHAGRVVKGALNPVATPALATAKFTEKRTPDLGFKEGRAVAEYERNADQEVPGVWSALRDSLLSAMLTGAVEAAGGRLSGKVASKIRKTPGFDKLANSDAVRPFLERYVKVTEKLNKPLTKRVRAALKRGGFDSVLPEVFEERLEEVLQGAAGFEDNYGATGELVSGVKSLDPEMIGNAVQTVLGELVGIGLFGAGVRAPAIAADLTAKGVGAVAERGTRRSEGRKNAIGLLLDQQAAQDLLSSAERWGQENPELARDLSESPSRSEFNAALKDSGIESPPATDIGVRSDFAVLARRAADLQSDVVEQPIAEGERVDTTDVIEAPAEVEGDQLPPGDDLAPTEAAEGASSTGVTDKVSQFHGKEPGESVTFSFTRNTESSPDMGGRFGQDVEPSGRYVVETSPAESSGPTPQGWERGELTFRNPLYIDFGSGYGEPGNWKQVLADRWGASGEELSKRLVDAGHDGIVVVEPSGYTSEIVDLTSFRHPTPTEATPAEKPPQVPAEAKAGPITVVDTKLSLKAKKVTELKAQLKEMGAKRYSGKNKAGLVEMILEEQARVKAATPEAPKKSKGKKAAPSTAKERTSTAFNFTIVTDKLRITKEMAGRGEEGAQQIRDANTAVVRHALSDIPTNSYSIEIKDKQGVWDGALEPSVSVEVEADENTLEDIRVRMNAIGLLFDQDEVHEVEFDVNIPSGVTLGGRDGWDHYQPYAVITLDRKVSWDEVESARKKSEISAAQFDGENILVYNTEETPEVFSDKVLTLIGAINESGRVQPTTRSGIAKIRRNGRNHSTEKGIRGYAEGSILHGQESSPLATNIALKILEHTGGRLKAPEARSLFTAKDLTTKQIALQREIADAFEAAPVNELNNSRVKKAYRALSDAVVEQYRDIIEGNLSIEFVPWKRVEDGVEVEKEPYPDSRAVVRDIRQNTNLRVLLTDPESFGPAGQDFSNHPLLRPSGIKAQVMDAKGKFSTKEVTYNDILRAVHDAIAHGLYSDSFGPVGEEGAWRAHIATIGAPWARWAITPEPRGHNSWVNYGPPVRDAQGRIISDKNDPNYTPVSKRGFAPQKATLLPIKYTLTGDPNVDAPVHQLKREIDAADTPKKSKGKKKQAEAKSKYARKTPGEESDATNAEIRKAMDEAFREDRKAEELQRIQKEKAAGQEEIDDVLKEIAKEARNIATTGLNPKLVKLAAKVVVKYVKLHINTSFEEFKVRVKYSDAASDMQDYLKRAWDLYQEDIGRYRALPTFERLPEELADYGKYLDKVTGAADRLNEEVAGSVFSEVVDWPKQINQAREKIEENPRIVQDTIDDILAHEFNVNELNFQIVLQSVLSIEVRVRQDAVDDIEEKESRGEMVPLDDQKEREERLEQVQKANRLYGIVWGRGGGARIITLTDEYHIDSMHNWYKREHGAEATGEDKKVIKKHSQAIRKSEKKFNEHEEQDIQRHVENEIDLSVASAKRETRNEKSRKLSAKSKDARKKVKEGLANLFDVPGKLDVTIFMAKAAIQIPQVLAATIELGAVTFQQSWHMIIPELRDIYEDMNTRLKAAGKKGVTLTDEILNELREVVKEEWGNLKEKPESYVDIDNPRAVTVLARKIQYDIIASGVLPSDPPKATRDMLVPLVQEALSEATGSEFTRQETEHALAKYGQYTPLPEDVIKHRQADINSQILANAQLETVEGGDLPLMTGSEPYPLSDETRRIRREVYQAKKGLDDAKYREGLHKSAVASELTRMRNFIADMEEAIRLGKPMDDGKRKPLEGAELDDMRKQLEEVKERYKEHFPPKGRTAEQQLKASLKSVEIAIKKAKEDIDTMKGGSLPTKTVKVVVESEQLTQRRAYLDELNSEKKILKAELLDPKKESIEERRDRIYRARLIRQRDEYDRRIANREFVSPKRKKRDGKMSNETLKAHSEWEKSKQAWKKEQRKFLRKNMGIWDRAYDIVKETAYLSTAITTSVDAGALFRQAGGAAVAHPSIAMKNFGIAVDAALSKKSLAEHERDYKNRPRYEYFIRAGLAIRDQLTEGEEAFLSQWAKHLPTIGPLLESSEVFHGTFLSIMRADLFDLMCHSVSPNGHLEINEAKQIANFVNQLTGRATFNSNSKIARALEAICRQTAWVFFSPRWVLSRFQLVSTFAKLLLPETLSGMSPRVKKVIAKEYGRTFGGYAVMTGAIYLLAPLLFADDDDEEVSYGTDWMSSEIGRVIVGDTRIDATFGMSTSLVFFSRFFTFNEDSDGRLKSKALRRFMRSKLAPVAGSVTDLWFSKNDHFATNLFGEEVSPWKMAINLATPLMVRDIHENMVKRGMPGSAALSMLAAVGVNSNTYGDRTDFVTAEPADRPAVIEEYLKNMGPTDDPNETWDERPSFWNMIDQRKLRWDKRFEHEKTKKWAKVVLDGVTEMKPERKYNSPTPYKEYVEKKREDFNKMIERLIPFTQSNTRNREELLRLALDLVKEDRVKYEPTYKDGVWNGGYKTTPMSSSVRMERRKRITTSFKNHWESE